MRRIAAVVVAGLGTLLVAPAHGQLVCQPARCPTPAVVDAARAIIERDCPCATQASRKAYKRCAKTALATARQTLGATLTRDCEKDVKAAVANATCGRAGVVACNKRNRKNSRTTCTVVRATKCKGSACGAFTSCLDACNSAAQACPTPGPTTTTTTTLPGGGVSCSIATAACTTSACSCDVDPGTDYHIGATGSVTGPVGAELRVNINAPQGGVVDCGGWTRIYGDVVTGCDVIGCCQRQGAQPETAQWSVFEAIDLPCFCPTAPDPGSMQHNFLIQCQLRPGPVTEVEQTSTGCP